MTTHIVAIRVLNEREGVVRNLVDKLNPLMLGSMIYAPLEDAAPVPVGRDLHAVCGNCVVDELERDLN